MPTDECSTRTPVCTLFGTWPQTTASSSYIRRSDAVSPQRLDAHAVAHEQSVNKMVAGAVSSAVCVCVCVYAGWETVLTTVHVDRTKRSALVAQLAAFHGSSQEVQVATLALGD